MSVNEKMTALADEVRELSGTTVKMGIENMTIEINSANDTIVEQANLLAQVITALDGKAAGSGNSGENLDTVLAEQQTLLNNLSAVLDNKASGGGGAVTGICPQLTIKQDMWIFIGEMVLDKIAYYSNGTIQTITAWLDESEEIGIEWNLAEPYIVQNIDIEKPILIVGHHQHMCSVAEQSENIEILFRDLKGSDTYSTIIFKITSTDPAELVLGEG